jgi:hypothetical protein
MVTSLFPEAEGVVPPFTNLHFDDVKGKVF